MKREGIKAMLPILQAFADGKVIQMLDNRSIWTDPTEGEGLPIGTLRAEPNSFRIKPEPKYRPFANAEECLAEMQKHQLFGWVIKFNKSKILIGEVPSDGVVIHNQRGSMYGFDEANRILTFADGTPFGILEEE